MKKILKLSAILLILLSTQMRAGEGMWIPLLLDRNHADMQKMGLRLTADQIYSINNSSMKDAIIQFGGGCSGTIISAEGLLLTNHHCGYGQIQAHSTVEDNILKYGFWAMTRDQEKPNPGLTARFLIRIEDVTKDVTAVLNDQMTETERNEKIREISAEIEKKATEGTHYTARVAVFYEGNEFYLFVYETFLDVRLVGTPSEEIGKFGGDTDNWMWPRHTGDFALFRVYMGPDGKPAPYSEDNIPFKPRHFLPISLDGVKEGDFAMIMGYPGRTNRFATSFSVDNLIERRYPTTVAVRTIRLDIIEEFSAKDPAIRLQYTSRQASIANGWKNNKGQIISLKKNRVIEQKQGIEREFREFARRNPRYVNVLSDIEESYKILTQYEIANQFQAEAITRGIEIFTIANQMTALETELKKSQPDAEAIKRITDRLRTSVNRAFDRSHQPLEIKNTAAMLKIYAENVPKHQQPREFVTWTERHRNNFDQMTQELYKSIFGSRERTLAFLNNPTLAQLERDEAFRMARIFSRHADEMTEKLAPANDKLRRANRMFVEGMRNMWPDRPLAPNANSTMRVTYGKVLGYAPADAVWFDYKTTLTGVMEKEDPTSLEFTVSDRLKELYERKDFGIYGENGRMIVNFIFDGDITGGNSGSSVKNANGEVIGLAFDGNWEAMSMDIFFHPELQRCINVDIRYVLFIIDKYAGARHLIDEMVLRVR